MLPHPPRAHPRGCPRHIPLTLFSQDEFFVRIPLLPSQFWLDVKGVSPSSINASRPICICFELSDLFSRCDMTKMSSILAVTPRFELRLVIDDSISNRRRG
jgi:hypothetical protein